MRVIIAGSRNVTDIVKVLEAVANCGFTSQITEIVSGGAKGVDKLGETIARIFEWKLTVFHAEWIKHGRSAGPIRNQAMAKYADALIAVWDGKSKGTKDMIVRAKKQGLRIYIHEANL